MDQWTSSSGGTVIFSTLIGCRIDVDISVLIIRCFFNSEYTGFWKFNVVSTSNRWKFENLLWMSPLFWSIRHRNCPMNLYIWGVWDTGNGAEINVYQSNCLQTNQPFAPELLHILEPTSNDWFLTTSNQILVNTKR